MKDIAKGIAHAFGVLIGENIISFVSGGSALALAVAVWVLFRDNVLNPVKDHYAVFLFVSLMSLLVGVAIGARLRSRQYEKVAEGVGLKDETKDEKLAADRAAFMCAPIWIKAMVKAALDEGEVYCLTDEWGRSFEHQSFVRSAFQPETIPGNRTRLKLHQEAVDTFSLLGDVFDCLTESQMRKYRVVDKGRSLSRHSSGYFDLGLTWWWYADDYEPVEKEETARLIAEAEARRKSCRDGVLTINVFDSSSEDDLL